MAASAWQGVTLLIVTILMAPATSLAAQLLPVGLPGQIKQGQIVRVAFASVGACEFAHAKFGDTFLPVFAIEGGFEALMGAGRNVKPGKRKLQLGCVGKGGESAYTDHAIAVQAVKWPIEYLQVAKNMASPPKSVLDRIQNDTKLIRKATRTRTKRKLWQGNFALPINSAITSPFGTGRIQNGKPRSPHGGVDLRAATGTPVMAPNDGIVVLAGDFYFSGNSVFIDHGGGLVSGYLHFSEITVKNGQPVKRGQVIGKSGSTGRVSAPHLHWQAHWLGSKIDPLFLTKLYQ